MDPLTHAISGAALARALPREPLPKQQVILLILLAMAPDADYILHFISDITYLRYHRGVTHSLLMLPLWTWLIYSLLRLRRGGNPLTPWLIGAAIAMHILLDLATAFGTMILAPLSDWRAAIDLVYIIDPLFTLCLLLPLLLAALWKRHGRLLACISLLLMGGYLGMTALAHHRALQLVEKAYPDAIETAALPLPFSPFHWQIIARFDGYYERAAIDLWPAFRGTEPLFSKALRQRIMGELSRTDAIAWQKLPSMDAAHLPAGLPGLKFYRWFARFPVLLALDKQHVEIGDLRFGAGRPGEQSAFRLRIEFGDKPQAWLIWRGERHSHLD